MLLQDNVLFSPALAEQPVLHGFTTRALGNLGFGKNPGDPEVLANREHFIERPGLAGRTHIQPKQVHSDRAIQASDFYPGCEADATYTSATGFLLSVLTADCVPILFFADGVVAAIHAGWRGLYGDIIPKTLAKLPKNGFAVIGPAIGPCCYEVGSDLASDFEKKFGKEAIDLSHPKPHLDLIGVAMRQLDACGVEEIDAANLCTHCHPELFFSYRRDGSSGRQMSFIALL